MHASDPLPLDEQLLELTLGEKQYPARLGTFRQAVTHPSLTLSTFLGVAVSLPCVPGGRLGSTEH